MNKSPPTMDSPSTGGFRRGQVPCGGRGRGLADLVPKPAVLNGCPAEEASVRRAEMKPSTSAPLESMIWSVISWLMLTAALQSDVSNNTSVRLLLGPARVLCIAFMLVQFQMSQPVEEAD